MISLVSLVVATTSATSAIMFCSDNRQAAARKSKRDGKSARSSKSKKSSRSRKSKSSKGRSSRSASKRRSSSKSAKKGSSSKGRRSSKSGAAGSKSSKSRRNGSSSKSNRRSSSKRSGSSRNAGSAKSEKSKSRKRSSKSTKANNQAKEVAPPSSQADKICTPKQAAQPSQQCGKKSSNSQEESSVLRNVPNASSYAFPSAANNCIPRSTDLYASPNKLPFDQQGQVSAVTLMNKSKNRKAFKVKCSDNMLYRVQPVYGFVDAGQQQKVEVLRMNGENKTDNLVILTSEVGKEDNDAKRVFENSQNNEMTVVPLIVA